MKNSYTIHDIARLSGTSKSTVSRYFNNGYVNEETAKRIKKVCDKLDYRPNTLASMMKAKDTRIIGVVTSNLNSTTSSRMITSLDNYLKQNDYSTVIINSNDSYAKSIYSINKLAEINCDGIVVLANQNNREFGETIKETKCPVVVMGQELKDCHCVIYDDLGAGREVAKYLKNKKFKNILYISVDEKDDAIAFKRKNGVLDNLDQKCEILISDFEFQTVEKDFENYLKKKKCPELIICSTDDQALAVYNVLKKHKLKVPKDVSLIGFDANERSQIIDLVTIRFNNEIAGITAAKSIIKLINKEEVPMLQTIGYVLIEGKTVK